MRNTELNYDEDGDNQVARDNTGEFLKHEWDETPHVIIDSVPVTDVQLSDVIMDGAYQVAGIAVADQHGHSARRFDLKPILWAGEDEDINARLVVPTGHRLSGVKRYQV